MKNVPPSFIPLNCAVVRSGRLGEGLLRSDCEDFNTILGDVIMVVGTHSLRH